MPGTYRGQQRVDSVGIKGVEEHAGAEAGTGRRGVPEDVGVRVGDVADGVDQDRACAAHHGQHVRPGLAVAQVREAEVDDGTAVGPGDDGDRCSGGVRQVRCPRAERVEDLGGSVDPVTEMAGVELVDPHEVELQPR